MKTEDHMDEAREYENPYSLSCSDFRAGSGMVGRFSGIMGWQKCVYSGIHNRSERNKQEGNEEAKGLFAIQ
jgi:hypothetical protein